MSADPRLEPDAVPAADAPADVARRRPARWLVEWALVLLVAVGVAFVVRTYVVQTFYIPSASMEPTLMVGDRIIVDKVSLHFDGVHRGDVIVFKRPPLETDPTISDLVKRVIGLPGETISSGPGGQVLIDGKAIAEPWLTPYARAHPGQPITKQKIPAGEYFVMGDNRSDSTDSRVFGPISGKLIVGGARFRIWPLSRLGGL